MNQLITRQAIRSRYMFAQGCIHDYDLLTAYMFQWIVTRLDANQHYSLGPQPINTPSSSPSSQAAPLDHLALCTRMGLGKHPYIQQSPFRCQHKSQAHSSPEQRRRPGAAHVSAFLNHANFVSIRWDVLTKNTFTYQYFLNPLTHLDLSRQESIRFDFAAIPGAQGLSALPASICTQ